MNQPKETQDVEAPQRGRAFWWPVYQDWRASGLSVAAYCREHGLGAANLYRWRRIFEDEAGDTAADAQALTETSFVQLRVVDAPHESNDAGIELLAGRQVRVRLARDFDAQALRRVIGLLEAG